jgi:transposase InsO family protein
VGRETDPDGAAEDPFDGETVPGTATINRILIKLGLVQPRKRKRPKDSYQRWERPGPMQLWQFDIVGGVWLVDPVTGVVREAKVVTGVDDHSRFCVSARVVERATGRQVCLAFAAALVKYGIPDEALTDNGKQFTGRFGRGVGEVLFDKICRHNGITHRLTEPASPTTTGKVERFHLTLRRELLDHLGPFTSVEEAQAVVDAWVEEYNSERPHQALDDRRPVTPADRFRPIPEAERALLPVWLPPTLVAAPTPTAGRDEDAEDDGEADHGSSQPAGSGWAGGPVELDRVVPPLANMILSGKQFWLGPVRPDRSCGSGSAWT